jgi:antibiotic biosynthesis monooxygenase (ABM) superfamily enzyme
VPFAIALFVGNIVSIVLLNYLVPRTSMRFSWWLEPAHAHRTKIDILGTGLVSALCLALVLVFWRLL